MKFSTSAVLTLAVAGSVSASRHAHGHHHAHIEKRVVTSVVPVPGPTVIAYVLDGKPISKDEACSGLKSGKYTWGDGDRHDDACDAPAPQPSSQPPAGNQFYESPSSTPTPSPTPTPTPSPKPSPPPKDSYENKPSKPQQPAKPDYSSGGQGLDADFPDGQVDCSEFPSKYGAIALDYLGLGGYTGIQHVQPSGDFWGAIRTAISGETCVDGAMCSYACPPGYQKSQWPTRQGSTGESVGGLACNNGKLHLTNPTLSKKLCIPGVGGVQVKNTLSQNVAVCRTDYPGTESETVPLNAMPGSTTPLTCPKAESYYAWKGMSTSAQYYVNPAGVPPSVACQWGQAGGNTGNWAPINLGVGEKAGAKWLSIIPNRPTTNAVLDYTVEIVGDNLGGACKYQGGKFHSLTGVSNDGCTVQVMSGDATFVFSQ